MTDPVPAPSGRSKWCIEGKDAESHSWCANRTPDEANCTCPCHRLKPWNYHTIKVWLAAGQPAPTLPAPSVAGTLRGIADEMLKSGWIVTDREREALEAGARAVEQVRELDGKLTFNEIGARALQAQKEAADQRAEAAEAREAQALQEREAARTVYANIEAWLLEHAVKVETHDWAHFKSALANGFRTYAKYLRALAAGQPPFMRTIDERNRLRRELASANEREAQARAALLALVERWRAAPTYGLSEFGSRAFRQRCECADELAATLDAAPPQEKEK